VNLLKYLSRQDPDLVEFALGKTGQRLLSFADDIDLTHPDVPRIYGGLFKEGSSFFQSMLEVMLIANFMYKKGLPREYLKTGYNWPKKIIKKIDSPFFNLKHIRLLENRYDRNKLREKKRIVTIRVKEKQYVPPNFAKFARFCDPYDEEIATAQERADHYLNMNCQFLYSKMMKDIQNFRIKRAKHYGFNQITMSAATLALANLLGSEPFHPKAYPIHLAGITPEMQDIIEETESFPEAKNKAIFDNFWLIAPDMSIARADSSVLLGEKDSKCYFIYYLRQEEDYAKNRNNWSGFCGNRSS
jgi:hypothetical protein